MKKTANPFAKVGKQKTDHGKQAMPMQPSPKTKMPMKPFAGGGKVKGKC